MQDLYLESKVLTAPPHRLHLMLIDGALQHGRTAEKAMRMGDFTAATAPLMKVIDIIGELLVGVRGQKTDVNLKIAEFYLFLFRRSAEAKVNDDVEKLSETLELLEYERQTWQLLCEKLASDSAGAPLSNANAPRSLPLQTSPTFGAISPIAAPGFSHEA